VSLLRERAGMLHGQEMLPKALPKKKEILHQSLQVLG